MRGYGNVLIMEEGEVSLMVYPKEKLGNVLEIQRAALDARESRKGHRCLKDNLHVYVFPKAGFVSGELFYSNRYVQSSCHLMVMLGIASAPISRRKTRDLACSWITVHMADLLGCSKGWG